jgi:hypothetical protein
MKHIELSRSEWERIKDQIRNDFGFSMPLLREKMKRELGFSIREHSPDNDRFWERIICVDFYSEEAKVWFTLKYL